MRWSIQLLNCISISRCIAIRSKHYPEKVGHDLFLVEVAVKHFLSKPNKLNTVGSIEAFNKFGALVLILLITVQTDPSPS